MQTAISFFKKTGLLSLLMFTAQVNARSESRNPEPGTGNLEQGIHKIQPPVSFPQPAKYYFLAAQTIGKLKADFEKGTLKNNPAIIELFRKAGDLLDKQTLTITTSPVIPPNGDPHEYYSMARYWWPDPAKPDGLPYIRKDGLSNPEIRRLPDHQLLDGMVDAVQTLSFAYFLSGDERYAAKAVAFLRTWFIDSSTRMNPDLDYAQVVKGRGRGRASGVLDARALAQIPDALQLLSASSHCSPRDIDAVRSWFSQYLRWLTTSKQGRGEGSAKNNHFTWYLVQVLPIADFTGDKVSEGIFLQKAGTEVLGHTLPDGRQPLELARTNAFGYSVFNLSACMELFTVCEHLGGNYWNRVLPGGQSLKKCLDFLVPYVLTEKKWNYPEIHPNRYADAYPLYLRASLIYKDPRYEEIVHRFENTEEDRNIRYLQWEYSAQEN